VTRELTNPLTDPSYHQRLAKLEKASAFTFVKTAIHKQKIAEAISKTVTTGGRCHLKKRKLNRLKENGLSKLRYDVIRVVASFAVI
jgi:hypothetical protein